VVRVKARRPAYWKVRTLDEFDGRAWGAGGFDRGSDDPLLDLPPNWQDLQRYHDRIEVSVQRMRGTHLVGAGTTLDVSDPTRRVQRGVGPGEFDSIGDLRTGDSYSARVYNPRPTDEQTGRGSPRPPRPISPTTSACGCAGRADGGAERRPPFRRAAERRRR
jgi:hypothetical protein